MRRNERRTLAAPINGNRGRGRPPCCPRELAERIVRMRLQGLTYGQTRVALNAKEIPKPMGGTRWRKSDVVRLLHTRYAKEILEESGVHEP
jgi:Recombinase